MNTTMSRLVFFLAFFLCSFLAHSQFTVSGTVSNDQKEKLEFAIIYIEGTNLSAATAKNGSYVIENVPAGNYNINCSYLGYETLKEAISITGNTTLDFTMIGSLYNLNQIEINSAKLRLSDFSASTTLNKEAIKAENLGQDVPAMLQMQTSMVTTSDAGAGIGYTGLRIRGTDQTRINVTVNDVPINDAESQNVFWVDLPDIASSSENIKIQRGVGPSTNGAASYGGTVALNTFGANINPFASINTSIGSFNTKKLGVILNSGLMNNQYNVEARYTVINSDGYVDRGAADLSSWYLEGSKVNSKSSLRFIAFSGKEVTYQSWNGAPQALVEGNRADLLNHYNRNIGSLYNTTEDSINLFNSNRKYNYYRYDNQVDDYNQTHLQLHYAVHVNAKLTIKASLHYTAGKGFFEQYRYNDDLINDYKLMPYQNNGDTIIQANLVRRRWLDNDFYGAIAKTDYSLNSKNLISVGGGINRYDGHHFGQVIALEYLDTLRKYSKGEYYRNTGKKTDANVYGRWESKWNDKISTVIDIQYRNVQYNVLGVDNDLRPLDAGKNFHFFNPKILLNYIINPQSKLIASFAVANREPDRNDFIDNKKEELPRHESLYDSEFTYLLSKKKFNLESTVYWMKYKNQLVITGELNDVGSTLRLNTPDSYRLGLELMSTYKISDQFHWSLNTTLSQNKIKKFEEVIYDYTNGFEIKTVSHNNTDISFSPSLVAGQVLTYFPKPYLSIALQSKYVGKQYQDNTSDDGRKLAAYNFSNLRFVYGPKVKFAKSVDVILQLNNIFNQAYSSNGYSYSYIYENSVTENFLYPQAGLHFMLGVNVKL